MTKEEFTMIKKPDVAVVQASTPSALAAAVNAILITWKDLGCQAAPVSVTVAPIQPPTMPEKFLTAVLSPDKMSDPKAWVFGISTNRSDWQRGKLFRNDAKSQSGTVVFQNILYYWGTTY